MHSTSPNMIRTYLLTLLATTAFAGPVPNSGQSSYISACEAADNCETYRDPTSGHLNIRFKSGMEPGTDDYNTRMANSHAKRQSGPSTTHVTIGDNTVFWGCGVDPVATLDNVGSVCATSGQCITDSPYTETVQYVSPTVDVQTPEPLTISAIGNYPTWMRNGLVQGLQAAMSAKGVVTTTAMNYLVSTGPINKNGMQTEGETCNVASAPSYIGLNVYSAQGDLQATIAATVKVQTPASGFCALAPALGLSGAVAGAFGPVGAGLGAIFGTVTAACAIAGS